MAAEKMLGRARAEAIAGQRIAPREQLEMLVRHHDMQEARHPAHRAIAVKRRDRRLRHSRFEPHRSAMAAALNLHGTVR